tara:strand:- start:103 stop:579 length:477 start_codon:yes stop_codon:yes gene_type:complete
MWLFFIFVTVPIIEIALFVQIGGWLGLFPTLLIVIITAALGTYLVRSQAIATFGNLRHRLEALDNPSVPLAEGAMILFAGALLLTPGFFTDIIGFLLLMPSVRQRLFQYLKNRLRMQAGKFQSNNKNSKYRYTKREGGPIIIEGEYHEETRKSRSSDE